MRILGPNEALRRTGKGGVTHYWIWRQGRIAGNENSEEKDGGGNGRRKDEEEEDKEEEKTRIGNESKKII